MGAAIRGAALVLACLALLHVGTASAQMFPGFPDFDINDFMPKDPCNCPASQFCPPGGTSRSACLPRTCANWVKHNCPGDTTSLKSISCSQAMSDLAGRISSSATFEQCFKSSKGNIICMQGPGALAADCTAAGGGTTVNTWSSSSSTNGGAASSHSSAFSSASPGGHAANTAEF